MIGHFQSAARDTFCLRHQIFDRPHQLARMKEGEGNAYCKHCNFEPNNMGWYTAKLGSDDSIGNCKSSDKKCQRRQ